MAALRHQRGLSQERLAERAGLSAPYLARIESGAREPTIRTLDAVAAALQVPLRHFFEPASEVPIAVELLSALEGLSTADASLIGALAIRLRAAPLSPVGRKKRGE